MLLNFSVKSVKAALFTHQWLFCSVLQSRCSEKVSEVLGDVSLVIVNLSPLHSSSDCWEESQRVRAVVLRSSTILYNKLLWDFHKHRHNYMQTIWEVKMPTTFVYACARALKCCEMVWFYHFYINSFQHVSVFFNCTKRQVSW